MFYEVTEDIAFAVIPKVASTSIYETVRSFECKQLTLEEAMLKPRRVVPLRDPIKRIKSTFNHFYWAVGECHTSLDEFMPRGIILADGHRLRGGVDRNPHHFTNKLQEEYLARVEVQRNGRKISDAELATEMDANEWKSFVDHIYSGGTDSHWDSQLDQITFKGVPFHNEVVLLEDLSDWWLANVNKGLLPHENSWAVVEKPDYREPELEVMYEKDITARTVELDKIAVKVSR